MKPIPQLAGLYATAAGDIVSADGTVLVTRASPYGPEVRPKRGGVTFVYLVRDLVTSAYRGPAPGAEYVAWAADGDLDNVSAANLSWRQSETQQFWALPEGFDALPGWPRYAIGRAASGRWSVYDRRRRRLLKADDRGRVGLSLGNGKRYKTRVLDLVERR